MRPILAAGSALVLVASSLLAQSPAAPPQPGLLFYLSAEKGTTADFAAPGTATPNFVAEVEKIADGAKGAALSCGDYQRLAYSAPGNIYAQRGTLSFFWRSRYPVGPTAFPIFRVAFADHSSWDQVWLRIDYNGHGFDAFVTDASLARVRVSVPLEKFPGPKEWTHLALAWDETSGIRFYINGKLAAENKTVAVLNVALDQFGPHSRIISSWQVQSDYNYTRGGDIDEVRIYDRALLDTRIATLAQLGRDVSAESRLTDDGSPYPRTLLDPATRAEWNWRYGFNHPIPALPDGKFVSIRKVEIHEAYDLKRWWWKANDGIRETTWPGVYNRSRLPGRNDYFQLPDWDCYVDSGKAVSFQMPNEPWNHLEISGAAWGKMELLKPGTDIENAYAAPAAEKLFERTKGNEHTVHALASHTGGQIRFTNVAQEEPIGELSAYNITAGAEPAGSTKLVFHIVPQLDDSSLASLQKFIAGRFSPDERATNFAQATRPRPGSSYHASPTLPLVHVLIPNSWDKIADGLDGIAIDFPALNFKPTHGDRIAFNLQVKDPLWPLRDMLDFTFTVKPNEAKTLWLDLRDRVLPEGKSFWLSIASSSPEFNELSLFGAEVRLVFKPRDAARPEHELDRFTQAKDTYAMLVEEHPNSPKLAMWVRFKGDLDDLLRVNPEHELGRQYATAAVFGSPRPKFTQPTPPEGVPLWAFRQTYLLGLVQRFVDFYIDHRQSEFGDFGGGISDDVDLLNTWPGVALMGVEPEKVKYSLHRLIEAAYKNGMFTNGLPTIQADELHSYEEGINCLAQNLILDYGNPRQLERAMDTARGIEWLTGINAAGHRHIRSSYYNGKVAAEEHPWGWAKPYSYLVCQVPQLLVDFNGSPAAEKIQLELADGLLAHRHVGASGRATLPTAIFFADDREGDYGRGYFPWHMFWTAYKWTSDKKYLAPILDSGSTMQVNANVLDLLDLRKDWAARNAPSEAGGRRGDDRGAFRPGSRAAGLRGSSGEHFAWQVDGDKSHLERIYAQQIEGCSSNEYIETEGSLWIDRVGVPTTELQRARLGGVALVRNALAPGHAVSWHFAAPAKGESVAILIPNATPTGLKVIAYNLETAPVAATMTGWNLDPGTWEITQGLDTNNDDTADSDTLTRTAEFGRSRSLELTLPPRATTILTLKLKTPGTPYWSRPDLGISRDDITRDTAGLHVRVHSLGSVPAPASTLAVRDAAGNILATAPIPALEAPNDLHPRTTDLTVQLPASTSLEHATIEVQPDATHPEITMLNNRVRL